MQFAQAYEAQPFRRAAYVGAGVVADQLGAFDAAATAALMGIRYLPQDPLLRHHLALVHLRHDRPDEAAEALEAQSDAVRAMPCSQLLGGLIDLQRGRWIRGSKAVRAVAPPTKGQTTRGQGTDAQATMSDDPDLTEAAERTLRIVALTLLALGVVSTMSALPLLVDLIGRPQPRELLATCMALWPLAVLGVGLWGRRRLRTLLRAPSGWGLRLSNPVSLRDTARQDG